MSQEGTGRRLQTSFGLPPVEPNVSLWLFVLYMYGCNDIPKFGTLGDCLLVGRMSNHLFVSNQISITLLSVF